MKHLHATRETDQVGSQTEACTLASCQANRGRQQVEDGEDGSGHEGYNNNLLNIGGLAGNDGHGNRNGQTLEEILDYASHELRNR